MLLMAFTPSLVSATVQIPDEIVVDGTTRALLTEPEPFVRYLKDSGQHAKLQPYLNWRDMLSIMAWFQGVLEDCGRQTAARQASCQSV